MAGVTFLVSIFLYNFINLPFLSNAISSCNRSCEILRDWVGQLTIYHMCNCSQSSICAMMSPIVGHPTASSCGHQRAHILLFCRISTIELYQCAKSCEWEKHNFLERDTTFYNMNWDWWCVNYFPNDTIVQFRRCTSPYILVFLLVLVFLLFFYHTIYNNTFLKCA